MVILAAVGEKHDQDGIIQNAAELAQAFDETLVVLHVLPKKEADEHFEAIRSIDEFKDTPISVEVDRAREIADGLAEIALGESEDVDVTPKGRIGDPRDEILKTADSIEPRYLVIGGRKRSPTGKALFGSVTQSTILDSEYPVVTIMLDS